MATILGIDATYLHHVTNGGATTGTLVVWHEMAAYLGTTGMLNQLTRLLNFRSA